MAERLAAELGLLHIELDGLFHVTDWESATEEEFRSALVAAMDSAPDGWVTCGNYITMSGSLHIEQADTVVWLDLPRLTVTWRTMKRTLRRFASRERLYGNDIREPLNNFYRWAPEKNIIRWAWVHHPLYREKYQGRIAAGEWQHLDVHHLTSSAAVDEYLGGVLTAPR